MEFVLWVSPASVSFPWHERGLIKTFAVCSFDINFSFRKVLLDSYLFSLHAFNCYHAAQPIHWIHDDSVMTEVVAAAGDNPEFISPSANTVYCLPTGKQSMYGDQLLVMLESLVACKGIIFEFDVIQLA